MIFRSSHHIPSSLVRRRGLPRSHCLNVIPSIGNRLRALIQVDLATTTTITTTTSTTEHSNGGPTGAGQGFSLFCQTRYHHFPGLVSYRIRVKDIKLHIVLRAADRWSANPYPLGCRLVDENRHRPSSHSLIPSLLVKITISNVSFSGRAPLHKLQEPEDTDMGRRSRTILAYLSERERRS